MHAHLNARRRAIVISTVALPSALAAAALSGCEGSSSAHRQLTFGSLDAAEEEIAELAKARALASEAVWTWAQTLEHCAQSIEYSLTGFPQSKSKLFQDTVGSAALGVFSSRGRMTHGLSEPIPGAPVLAVNSEPDLALARLQSAIAAFRNWTKPLQPHFAYGALDKKRYELAHAMHIGEHLSQFRAVG